MKRAIFATVVLPLAAAALLVGCTGVNEKFLDEAQKQIADMQAKGVPDSLLSGPRTKLYEARDQLQKTDYKTAHRAAEALKVQLKQAVAAAAEIAQLGPTVDGLLSQAAAVKPKLSGMQLRKLDSLGARVTALKSRDSLYQAKLKADSLVTYLPTLVADEQKAQDLRRALPGTWVCEDAKKIDAEKVNSVEKKTFTFTPDGKVSYVETGKGRTEKNLKKDYEFHNFGTWDCSGDTVYCFVNRYTQKRLTVEIRHDKEGGGEWWEKRSEPAYDSTITDHSQDRWITLADLKLDFAKR